MINPLSVRPPAGRALTMRLDLVLVLTTLAAAVLGVVFVYSATRTQLVLAGVSPHYYLDRQAAYVVAGVVVMVVLALVDYHWLEYASTILYAGILLALLSMFVIGSSALGATRWLQVGPVQIQPSAFATLVMIVVVATFCARRPEGLEPVDLGKVLVEGKPADVIVYDPDTVDCLDQERLFDYPAGEWRLVQKATGYDRIIVNGVTTFIDGQCTDATPGRLLRHGTD